MKNLKFQVSRFIATFFYVGFFPVAPGTAGSLVSAILIYFLPTQFWSFNIFTILILLILGLFCSAYLESVLQIKDPQWIVIDEVLGMFLTTMWVSKSWYAYVVAFLLFRFFDITKFYPIKRFESIKTPGFGVMFDDIIAAIYASIPLMVLHKLGIF